MTKTKILFICSHNAARSQMAEAIANSKFGDILEASSAGSSPTRIDPYAITVMKELGIDISKNRAKHLSEFTGMRFNYAVTLCSDDEDFCPFFPDADEHLHHSVNEPVGSAKTEEGRLAAMRSMRDDILAWIRRTFVDS
jgi:arsenate reductase (thioredoxin)